MKKVIIIDNYDSFTYILKQYFGEMGCDVRVFFNDKITVGQIRKMKPAYIILSPGPGTVEEPKDTGVMFDVIKEFYNKIPILGVCFGHQAIGKFFGYKIVRAPRIMHGKRSHIKHNGKGLYRGVQNPFKGMRYHSLAVATRVGSFAPFSSAQDDMLVTASSDDGVIMGIQHKEYPVSGVQFHPESLGTKEGKKIIKNFLMSF